MDRRAELRHDIGDCGLGDDPNETDPNQLVGPPECAALCEAHCGGLDGSFTVHRSGCEGYCRAGVKDGVICSNDIDCFAADPNQFLDSGECVGGEPVAHRNRCQCECIETGGSPARPGSFECDLGYVTAVEIKAPCDGQDVTLFSDTCDPFTLETMDLTMFDMDLLPGETVTIPNRRGNPASCQQLAADNTGTLKIVGIVFGTDGGLGDNAQELTYLCRGPDYSIPLPPLP
jgi:hypothetical protein